MRTLRLAIKTNDGLRFLQHSSIYLRQFLWWTHPALRKLKVSLSGGSSLLQGRWASRTCWIEVTTPTSRMLGESLLFNELCFFQFDLFGVNLNIIYLLFTLVWGCFRTFFVVTRYKHVLNSFWHKLWPVCLKNLFEVYYSWFVYLNGLGWLTGYTLTQFGVAF